MGRGQAKSNEVPKTKASPCQSGILSPTPSLWAQQREQSKQRAKSHRLSNTTRDFSVLPGPCWRGTCCHARTERTAPSVWAGPSSLPQLRVSADSHRPAVVRSPIRGRRSQVYSMSTYTFLPWGFSNWQGSPQPPAPPHLLIPHCQAGSSGGWAETACRRGCKMGRPHQTHRRMAFSSTFYETKPP